MKTPIFELNQSAPICQLNKIGTDLSQGVLSKAIRFLSNSDLIALEEDLSVYDQTGLVGVRMSKILALLGRESTSGSGLAVRAA